MGNIKGFTLVELIVVITILAILGSIAFVALQGYGIDSRNSVRLMDVTNFEKGIEIYITETGLYPMPDESVKGYDGADVISYTGTTGEISSTNARLNDAIVDPLTYGPYEYAIEGTMKKYQIRFVLEGDNSSLIEDAYAFDNDTTVIRGNYNKLFARSSGGSYYSMPSLVFSGDSDVDLSTSPTVGFYVSGIGDLISYAPINLSNSTPATDEEITSLITALQNEYSSITELQDNEDIIDLLSMTASDVSDIATFKDLYISEISSTDIQSSEVMSGCVGGLFTSLSSKEYTVLDLDHGQAGSVDKDFTEGNNVNTYTLSYSCQDGTYLETSETSILSSCVSGYTLDAGVCFQDCTSGNLTSISGKSYLTVDLAHSLSGTVTKIFTEGNEIRSYTLNYSCNNGVYNETSETSILSSCVSGYTLDAGVCVQDGINTFGDVTFGSATF